MLTKRNKKKWRHRVLWVAQQWGMFYSSLCYKRFIIFVKRVFSNHFDLDNAIPFRCAKRFLLMKPKEVRISFAVNIAKNKILFSVSILMICFEIRLTVKKEKLSRAILKQTNTTVSNFDKNPMLFLTAILNAKGTLSLNTSFSVKSRVFCWRSNWSKEPNLVPLSHLHAHAELDLAKK